MDPVLFDLGFIQIHWYSFLLFVAFAVALFLAMREAKRFNIGTDFMFNMIFWTVIFGFIGARLYYVLFNWSSYSNNLIDIVKTWNGGLAIHGGLIAGIITVIVYTKKYKVKALKILDISVVSMLIAQAIGRWGNFFNGEAHGAATTLEKLKGMFVPDFIAEGMKIGGIYYQPTFFYESLWCLLGFIILMIVRRNKYLKIGQLTCLYMMWYGVGRFFIETMRTDSLMLGGFKAAQIISIVMVIGGLLAFMVLTRKGKFEDLYNEAEAEVRF